MSDTPRTDSAISHGHVVDADFARTLERELNEAKKSPWKPLSEIPEALKDGRLIIVKWEPLIIDETTMVYGFAKWSIERKYWSDYSGRRYFFEILKAYYMEIPE